MLVYASVLIALIPLVWVLWTVISSGLSVLLHATWWTHTMRNVTYTDPGGGALHAIVGTLEQVAICTVISVPVAILVGVYLVEYGRGTLARTTTFMVDILTGIPSIVAALFIFTLMVETLNLSRSGWMVSLALIILMVPVIVRATEEMLKLVPNELREASYALGVPKWKTIVKIVIPTAFTGLVTGVVLGIARVAGETAPLLILVSYSDSMNSNPFSGAQGALPTLIRDQFSNAGQTASGRSQLPPRPEDRPAGPGRRDELRGRPHVGCGAHADPDRPRPHRHRAPDRPQEQARELGAAVMAKRIDAKNLNIYYGKFLAVSEVNFTIEPRSVTAFIGPSGCGKSTVLRTLNRMHEVIAGARVEGDVLLDGDNIYGSAVDPVNVRRTIGMVFQRPNPFPTMSIYDNVAAGLKLTGKHSKQELDGVVEKALRGANLWEEVRNRLDKPGAGLSGGQQQRLCIARAIAVEPQVLLMDEPCSALDPISTLAIEDLIQELKQQYTIVIVTHNMQQAARVSERTAFFNLAGIGKPGQLIEMDDTEKIFSNPSDKRTEDYISGRFG